MSERTIEKARQVVHRLSEWYFAEGGDNDPDSPIDREDLDALHDLVRTAEATLRTARGEVGRVQEPTQEQIDDACMWYRHDFGLLSEKERDSVRFEARQWFRAWGKALSNGDDPAAFRSDAQGEDRWEDVVFGPITQAYNEAHAARRGDGDGD